MDAPCAPADIHYPTEVSLLNGSREKLEELTDTLHDSKKITNQGHTEKTLEGII
jgi:transposase, IS5 family